MAIIYRLERALNQYMTCKQLQIHCEPVVGTIHDGIPSSRRAW